MKLKVPLDLCRRLQHADHEPVRAPSEAKGPHHHRDHEHGVREIPSVPRASLMKAPGQASRSAASSRRHDEQHDLDGNEISVGGEHHHAMDMSTLATTTDRSPERDEHHEARSERRSSAPAGHERRHDDAERHLVRARELGSSRELVKSCNRSRASAPNRTSSAVEGCGRSRPRRQRRPGRV